ncbi:GNAT family N-acetyltransferase [Bifidobacterium sp. UBA744]|uniref:GNAT family N-acetyltransferase n=1 Tax=Bifidobacterium sp. UBA744 TaxID=1946112 RepID=UPI0025B92814|nr:GNAT family N-acetyltransferase [Bifidobacterium sp. UBA744]
MLHIRRVDHDPSDIRSIARIYNASVTAGGSTADLEPQSFEQRLAWVTSHREPYGVYVVETDESRDEGDGGVGASGREIVAFGALSVFYDRPGYDGVVDLAYYVAPDRQGRGIGTALLDFLLREARRLHMRKAIGIIFADNAGSTALMRRFGFTRFGLLPRAARSTRGMHDMSYWHLDL